MINSYRKYKSFEDKVFKSNVIVCRLSLLLLVLLDLVAFILFNLNLVLLILLVPTVLFLIMSYQESFNSLVLRVVSSWILIFMALLSSIVNKQNPSPLFALALASSQLLFLLDDISSWSISLFGYLVFISLSFVFKPKSVFTVDALAQLFTLVFSCSLGFVIRHKRFDLLQQSDEVEKKNSELRLQSALEYKAITKQTLHTIARTIDAKDEYTRGHSVRVASYSQEIGRRMGLDESGCESLFYTALLHDIGKIGIPEEILNKKGKQTSDEYEIVKTHPAIGGRILSSFVAVEGIADGAVYHHERYDGNGYNQHLKGTDIPINGRIICACDAFDALTSDRSYRKAYTKEQAKQMLQEQSGKQFDPQVIRILLEVIDSEFDPFSSQDAIAFNKC